MRARSGLARRVTPATEIIIPAVADDGTLQPMEKMEAHRTGALHIAVSVFLFNGDELLIQRRAAGKYHSGLMWANTCCSHPYWGETVEEAAHRRLEEELGVSLALAPTTVFTYRVPVSAGLIEHERVHVFRAHCDARTLALAPNPAEVAETRWASPSDLRREAAASPDAFAPWFRLYLDRWSELGL
jgi:isopentenyl-diphosphate Delta-isomerase